MKDVLKELRELPRLKKDTGLFLRISTEAKREITKLAKAKGLTVSNYIRMAIADFMEKKQ